MPANRSQRCAGIGSGVVLALFCAAPLTSQTYQWDQNPTNRHLYTLTAPMPWASAEAEAQRLGGHLVTVRSQAEHDWIVQQFGTGRFWIGLNDMANEGVYEWASGASDTFRAWADGEPNGNRPDEDAVEMAIWANGSWNDQQPTDQLAGIVEWDPGDSHSLELDGIDAMGQTAWPVAPLTGMTFEGWIRLRDPDPRTYFAPLFCGESFPLSLGHAQPVIRMSDGAVLPWRSEVLNTCTTPAAFLTFGEWHHVAVVTGGVFFPLTTTLFIDGQSVAVCSEDWAESTSTPMTLGAWEYNGSHVFHLAAQVDELRISSIPRYFTNFVPESRLTSDTSTMALWHFDEGTGSIALDSSGNDRHLALTGGYQWVQYGPNDPGIPPSASYATYRLSCDSSVGTPQLSCSALPRVGHQMQIDVTGLGPNRIGYLLFGFQDQTWGLNTLPLDLAAVGAPGCFVNVDPAAQFVVPTNLNGDAGATYPIPNDPAIAGITFFNQYVSLDDAPPGRMLQIATTNAGRGVVGL